MPLPPIIPICGPIIPWHRDCITVHAEHYHHLRMSHWMCRCLWPSAFAHLAHHAHLHAHPQGYAAAAMQPRSVTSQRLELRRRRIHLLHAATCHATIWELASSMQAACLPASVPSIPCLCHLAGTPSKHEHEELLAQLCNSPLPPMEPPLPDH